MSGTPIRLLVVEDDDGHAELICEQLETVGISNPILRLRDGQEAWDHLKDPANRDQRHVILLDIRMPRMDGLELLGLIKRDEALKNTPVIMLTTTDSPMEIQKCYDLGCNCYITKPVNFRQLAERLRSLGLLLLILEVPETRR